VHATILRLDESDLARLHELRALLVLVKHLRGSAFALLAGVNRADDAVALGQVLRLVVQGQAPKRRSDESEPGSVRRLLTSRSPR
jgi:hypothetical protein